MDGYSEISHTAIVAPIPLVTPAQWLILRPPNLARLGILFSFKLGPDALSHMRVKFLIGW
jgi:hypothetical protein